MGTYHRLTFEEREELSRFLAMGLSLREIGRRLRRSASTVSREVGRFRLGALGYRATTAQRRAQVAGERRRVGKRKLLLNRRLLSLVEAKLKLRWSPQQIARYLKRHYESCSMHISAEAIYSYLYVFLRRELRAEFTRELRRAHKKRRKRGRSAKGQTAKLDDMTLIDERPAEVLDRLIPGHWEGDLMIGGARAQSALGTLIERTTRFAILVPMKNKTAKEVRKQFAREIMKLPAELRLSLTYDQGREMAQHKLFTKQTQMKVYFAHPSSPWERGTNENTNGLIRQYFPKGTDFTKVSRREIKRAQRQLNTRPRQTLDWKTPQEAMRDLLR
jgi:transposase, IS30 family